MLFQDWEAKCKNTDMAVINNLHTQEMRRSIIKGFTNPSTDHQTFRLARFEPTQE